VVEVDASSDDERDTWPPSFAWHTSGASFDVVELEVTAGQDVAFGHALLRSWWPGELPAPTSGRSTGPDGRDQVRATGLLAG
jgi:hypothetical protein